MQNNEFAMLILCLPSRNYTIPLHVHMHSKDIGHLVNYFWFVRINASNTLRPPQSSQTPTNQFVQQRQVEHEVAEYHVQRNIGDACQYYAHTAIGIRIPILTRMMPLEGHIIVVGQNVDIGRCRRGIDACEHRCAHAAQHVSVGDDGKRALGAVPLGPLGLMAQCVYGLVCQFGHIAPRGSTVLPNV